MAFPTLAVTTTNLDAGTDGPADARPDLLDGMQKLNQFIADQAKIVRTDGTPAPVLLVLEVSGENGSPVSNLGATPQTVTSLDCGTVTAGQRIEVNASAVIALAESSDHLIYVEKESGTATIAFGNDGSQLLAGAYFLNGVSSNAYLSVHGTCKVTGSGTLVLRLRVMADAGTNNDVGTGNGQALARVLSA